MRKFKQQKLWRDKCAAKVEARDGSVIHWRRLDDTEFDEQLRKKLIEEAQEAEKEQDRKKLIRELADIYEVIDSLADLYKISKNDILVIQTKNVKNGAGFQKGASLN